MRSRLAAVLAALAAISLGRGAALAEELAAGAGPAPPSRARVLLPACDELPFDRAALIDTLRVELLASRVELVTGEAGDQPEGSGAILVVDVPECGRGARLVELRLEDPASGQRVGHDLEVTEQAGEVQSRIIAIALAELLRSSWDSLEAGAGSTAPAAVAEQAVDEERAPAPARPEATAPVAPAPARAGTRQVPAFEEDDGRVAQARPGGLTRVTADVLVDGRAFVGANGAQIGGRVGASMALGRAPLRLDLDVGGWYGQGFDPLGSIDVATLLVGASLLWAGGRGGVSVSIGPRIELGWGRAAGRALDEDVTWSGSFDAVVSTLALRAALRVRLGARVLALVDGQVGYVLAGLEARVGELRATGIGGPLIALGLGLSIEPRRRTSSPGPSRGASSPGPFSGSAEKG